MLKKRIFDLSLLSAVFPFALIICLLIIFLMFLINYRPFFFIQARAGLNGKKFHIYKFRTMTVEKKKYQKVTKIGYFLRKSKLDELPQIFNVLNGDMSFVGPRPLYLAYNKFYTKNQRKRLKLKPGITGCAQINERKNLTWKKKFEYDLKYLDNYSILLDINILFKTFLIITKSIFGKKTFFSRSRFDKK